MIYAVGAVGSLLGVVLYQSALKDYDFRSMLLWGQVLSSLTGMLDLALVTRLNTKVGMPDYVFAVIDCGVSVDAGSSTLLQALSSGHRRNLLCAAHVYTKCGAAYVCLVGWPAAAHAECDSIGVQ